MFSAIFKSIRIKLKEIYYFEFTYVTNAINRYCLFSVLYFYSIFVFYLSSYDNFFVSNQPSFHFKRVVMKQQKRID